MSANDEINVKIGAQTGGLLSGLQQAEQAISHSTGYIRANLNGLTDVVERIKLPFIELAAILAGGAMFKSFVSGTEELAHELEKASAKTGITTGTLQGLKFQAEQVAVGFDTVITSAQKLSLVLQQAIEGKVTPGAQALKALGISATDAAGNTRPLEDVIGDIADKFKGYKDGADKTALAMNLFGRGGAAMIPMLNEGSGATKEATKATIDYGAVMSGPALIAAGQFHEAMGHVGLVSQGLKITLGTALMPALTLMANALADSAKEGGVLHEVILVLRDAVELLAVAFIGLVTGIRLIWEAGKFVFNSLVDAVVGFGKVLHDVLGHQWVQAAIDMKTAGASMAADFNQVVGNMVTVATAGGKAIAATLGKATDSKPKSAATGNAPHIAGKDTTLEELKKQWELEKAGYNLEIAQADEAQEKIIEIKRRELERVRQLFGEHSKEYLEMAAELERDVYKGQKEAQKLIDDLHKKAEENEKKAFEERKRQWETLLSGISNAIQTSVTGIIQGTTTMSAAIKNILKSLVAEYIAVGVKSLIAHKATELAKTGATVQGTAQRVALEQWAAIKSVALSAWSAIKSIGIYAIEGAAAAFKAIAAIPFVGPFMAPAAAAAAGIAIMGFAGHVASAEGGYDIPRGLNPMTQLHSNEMVLPSSLADKVRNMTSAGSGGSVHFNVNAIDGASVKKFFVEHGDKIIAVVQKGARDFKLDG